MSKNIEPTQKEMINKLANHLSEGVLELLERTVVPLSNSYDIQDSQIEIKSNALTIAMLKLIKIHNIDMVQFSSDGDNFIAIGVSDASTGTLQAKQTKKLIKRLESLTSNGGKCACGKCVSNDEPSLNEQTTNEILAEIEKEQA